MRAVDLSAGIQFSQQDVDSNQLIYQHDGSEATTDYFTFSLHFVVAAAAVDERPLQTFTFNISVLPVDDQPFQLITTSPRIHVVQGSAGNITPDMLLTLDDDTPPERIIYQVKIPPTNGHLRNVDLPPTHDVTEFSQLDVDQLKISFVSDGSRDNSTFYFNVSDGVHKSLYKVSRLDYFVESTNNCFY